MSLIYYEMKGSAANWNLADLFDNCNDYSEYF